MTKYSLSNDENNNIELAFELYKEDQDSVFLTRDRFLDAYSFFLSLYDPIKDELKEEKIQIIKKAYISQLNQNLFVELIKQSKTSNRGFAKKHPDELNKNFIMKHLGEKHIIHIDKCWGKFDKRKLGYIQYNDIRNCIDMILDKYNTQKLNYQPYLSNEELQTVSSPPLKPINQSNSNDFLEKSKKIDSEKPSSLYTDHDQVISEIHKYKDESKSNQIEDWLASKDCKNAISFEKFANFISKVIVDNNLTFFNNKTKCNCTIF